MCTGGGTGYRYAQYNPTNPGYSYSSSYSYEYTSGVTSGGSYSYSYSYVPRFSKVAGKTFQVRPTTATCDGALPQGLSSGAIQVLLGDSSVRGLVEGMSVSTWHAALTPNAGDTMGSDWGN
jgi:hypothetical protein